MSRLTRDGTAEPVSRDQILRHERGQGNIYFPCSADHEQGWQPYPVDPYFCYISDHTGSNTRIVVHRRGLHLQKMIRLHVCKELGFEELKARKNFSVLRRERYVLKLGLVIWYYLIL